MNNKPLIRFKGFTDPWEQRKAKELCSITTGSSNTQDQTEEGIYPFFIRSDLPVRSKKYLFDEEAVITIGDGNIGKVFHYINGKFDLHQRCYKMSNFKHLTAKYFYWFFSTKFYKRALSMTAKATVDSVRLETISEMNIKYPLKSKEQNNISNFLFNIDNLIALHQRKYEKLQNIKKGLLDKMFPTGSSNIPSIRFKGFTDPWEQRKFAELYDKIESGNRLPKLNLERGDIPYIVAQTTNNGINSLISRNIKDFNGNQMKLFNSPSITFSIDNPEAIFVQNKPFFTSNIMRVLYNDKYNFYHCCCFLNQLKKLAKEYNWSFKFSGPIVMNSTIFISSLSEFNLIGKFISTIDSLITLHQRKYEKLQNIKKGLLDKMFC